MNELIAVAMSGFVIGILGSFHCVGMCGPIALALPIQHLNQSGKLFAVLLYNGGRATTYAIMGLAVGTSAQGIALFGWQQGLSVLAGIIVLLLLLNRYRPFLPSVALPKQLTEHIAKRLYAPKNISTYAAIGLFNGLLPCGLTYIALAAALATQNFSRAALLMFAFGVGTIPMMASITVLGKYVSQKWRIKINNALPYGIACMAIWLIVRGLGLGIPYLSPAIETINGKCTVSCCQKNGTPDK